MTQPTRGGNLIAGVFAALAAAVAAGALWTVAGTVFDFQISFAAIAVGAAVGWVAGRVGGADPVLAVLSGLLGALAVFMGDLFIVAHSGAKQLGVSSFSLVTGHFNEVWLNYKENFVGFATVLFYGLAAYFGFRVAMTVGMQQHGPQPTAPPPPAWQPPTGEPTTPPPASDGVPDMYKKDVPPTA